MSPAREPTYELVMPFVVCATQGGPYEDRSFVAGYELGCIAADPALVGSTGRHIRTESVPQADLIAMHHNLSCEVGDADESGEWTHVRFHVAEVNL